jgi:predicted nucleic acid-binding protein
MKSMGTKPFVDTNVFLDLLLDRGQFAAHADNFLTTSIENNAIICTSSACIQTIVYVLEKTGCSREVIKKSILKILIITAIVDTKKPDIYQALQSQIQDVEDGILYFTAINNDCDCLVTRNTKDYPESTELIRIIKPEEY